MKNVETIWNEYHSKLAAFIRSKVAKDAVEDLLQEVFMKIHTHIGSLDESAKLESWIYQITRNAITDHYRSNKKTEKLPEWLEDPQPEDDKSIRDELVKCLLPMIEELPSKYRDALLLSELESRTQNEVAEMAGISLSGAKSRVQRGRVLLKSMLQECCSFEINKHNQLLAFEKKSSDCKYC